MACRDTCVFGKRFALLASTKIQVTERNPCVRMFKRDFQRPFVSLNSSIQLREVGVDSPNALIDEAELQAVKIGRHPGRRLHLTGFLEGFESFSHSAGIA